MDWATIVDVFGASFRQFDWIIFIVAGVNFVFFVSAWGYMKKVDKMKHGRQNRTISKKHESFILPALSREAVDELSRYDESAGRWYSVFVNTTSMFPLFGILGTVLSLINLVGGDSDVTQQSFFVALTSTGWGVIFSILFKAFDAVIAPKIEKNKEDVARKIQQFELE